MALQGLGLGPVVARHAQIPSVRPPPSPPVPSLCSFTVTERQPLLVTPNRSTPSQRLYLTNIDDQLGLRCHVNMVLFYPSRNRTFINSESKSEHPAEIIGDALGKLLVQYYPFAGRVRDADKGKLVVDCFGEGVLFVEADADISMEELGDSTLFPRGFNFIKNVPGSESVTDTPIIHFQVTRLKCGGFILGLRYNHAVTDGAGIAEFLKALGEIARGAAIPSVPPVWEREILRPRANPAVRYSCVREYYDFEDKYKCRESTVPVRGMEEMSLKSFYFGSKEIEALKRQVEGVRFCTSFDVISACLWQSRIKATNIPADEEVALMFPLNARGRFRPRLPVGYYGNLIASAYAKTRAGELRGHPLSFATKLINEGKRRVDEEYIRSVIDLAELNGRPHNASDGSFIISDISNLSVAIGEADFGWGKPVNACPVFTPMPNFSYFLRPSLRDTEGFVVPVCLPVSAMELFEENLNNTLNNGM